VWRGQSFASSWWFCLQGVSSASLQDFTIGGMLSASSILLPSWNPNAHFLKHFIFLALSNQYFLYSVSKTCDFH
jgi:hypothetical protein